MEGLGGPEAVLLGIDFHSARHKTVAPAPPKVAQQVRPGAYDIKGNTLRAYLFLLKSGPSELRDVQRSLGFSTPSLASYHLKKLVESGLAQQDERGRYLVTKDSTKEILEGYVRVGTVVFPQLFFLSVFFTVVIGYLGYMSLGSPSYAPLLAVASLALVCAFWFETYRVWRRLTTWK